MSFCGLRQRGVWYAGISVSKKKLVTSIMKMEEIYSYKILVSGRCHKSQYELKLSLVI